jgi:hypothetical protein
MKNLKFTAPVQICLISTRCWTDGVFVLEMLDKC